MMCSEIRHLNLPIYTLYCAHPYTVHEPIIRMKKKICTTNNSKRKKKRGMRSISGTLTRVIYMALVAQSLAPVTGLHNQLWDFGEGGSDWNHAIPIEFSNLYGDGEKSSDLMFDHLEFLDLDDEISEHMTGGEVSCLTTSTTCPGLLAEGARIPTRSNTPTPGRAVGREGSLDQDAISVETLAIENPNHESMGSSTDPGNIGISFTESNIDIASEKPHKMIRWGKEGQETLEAAPAHSKPHVSNEHESMGHQGHHEMTISNKLHTYSKYTQSELGPMKSHELGSSKDKITDVAQISPAVSNEQHDDVNPDFWTMIEGIRHSLLDSPTERSCVPQVHTYVQQFHGQSSMANHIEHDSEKFSRYEQYISDYNFGYGGAFQSIATTTGIPYMSDMLKDPSRLNYLRGSLYHQWMHLSPDDRPSPQAQHVSRGTNPILSEPQKSQGIWLSKKRKSSENSTLSGILETHRNDMDLQRMFHLNELNLVLYKRGLLEMGRIDGFSETLSTFFQEIYSKMACSKSDAQLWSDPKIDCHQELKKSFEGTKYYMAKHFFGGIGLIYQMDKDRIGRELLMEEGKIFIKEYLSRWVSISHSQDEGVCMLTKVENLHHSNAHERLLSYTMYVNNGRKWSYGITLDLLKEFTGSLCQKFPHWNLEFIPNIFTKNCKAMLHDIECKSQWEKYGWKENTLTVTIRQSVQESQAECFKNLEESESKKDVFQIYQEGMDFMKKFPSFYEKTQKFIKSLEKSFMSNCQGLKAIKINSRRQKRKNHNGNTSAFNLNKREAIQSVIMNVQDRIIPAFIYILKCYHKKVRPFKQLEMTLLNGWNFLRNYFDKWKEIHFKGDIFVNKVKSRGIPFGFIVDWSNNKEVFQYLLEGGVSLTHPCVFAQYLAEQWDDQLKPNVEELPPSAC